MTQETQARERTVRIEIERIQPMLGTVNVIIDEADYLAWLGDGEDCQGAIKEYLEGHRRYAENMVEAGERAWWRSEGDAETRIVRVIS